MDPLRLIGVLGGSDLYGAGTYKTADGTLPHPIGCIKGYASLEVLSLRERRPGVVLQVSVVTLTGAAGSDNLVLGAKKYPITFDNDLSDTADNFVTAYAAEFLLRGIVVTADSGVITFTSTKAVFEVPYMENSLIADPTTTYPYATTTADATLSGTVVTTGDDGFLDLFTNYAPDLSLSTTTPAPTTITDGTEFYFEYPIEEIVIGSGTAELFFVK